MEDDAGGDLGEGSLPISPMVGRRSGVTAYNMLWDMNLQPEFIDYATEAHNSRVSHQ